MHVQRQVYDVKQQIQLQPDTFLEYQRQLQLQLRGFNSNSNPKSWVGVGVEPNSNPNSGVDPNPGMYYRVASRDIRYLLYFTNKFCQIQIDVHLVKSPQNFLFHVVNQLLP